MDILYLLILGFVQGLTEFLPISSSGHLVLLSTFFGIEDSLLLSIILHCATLLSICVVLWKDVLQLIKNPLGKKSMNVLVASIPTCVIALVLMPLIELSFGGGALPLCFLISAALLIFAQYRSKNTISHALSTKDAFIIGVFQGFATFPGISRSGATISGGLISGADRKETAKFSFLISIPIIILSMILEIYKIIVQGQPIRINILGLIFAFLLAFLVGIAAIKTMLKLTEKSSLKGFAIYLILIAIISIFV